MASLSEEEAGFAEYIIYLRETLPEKADPMDQKMYDEMNKALPEQKVKGIDVDEIIP